MPFSGSGGVWAMKGGDFQATNFAGTGAGIQAAIDYIGTNGGKLFIGPGSYTISTKLTFDPQSNASISILGAGVPGGGALPGTLLIWAGNSTDPLLDLRGVRDSRFEGFGIRASSSFPLAMGIRSITVTGGALPAYNQFKDIWIDGTTNAVTKGIAIVPGTLGDTWNASFVYENVTISNYTTAAVSIEHDQAGGHLFYGCNFYNGQRGIATNQGASSHGGSYHWYGGTMSGHTVSDFDMGGGNSRTLIISGHDSEGSSRLIATDSSTGTFPVTVQDTRFACNALNADGYAIVYQYSGPLVLTGSSFGEGAQSIPKIRLVQNGTNQRTVVSGNMFGSYGSNAVDPISTSGSANFSIIRQGNTYWTAGGASSSRSDEEPFAIQGVTTPGIRLIKTGAGANTASIYNDGGFHVALATGIANYASADAHVFLNQSQAIGFAQIDSAGLTLLGGTAIKKHLSATASLNFDLTAVVVQDLTITVTGAAVGDTVSLGVDNAAVTGTIQYTAWVSAANTVTVRARTAAIGENPASGTFRADVWQH